MIKVPYLSREQIEREAEALIVEYEQARGVIVGPQIPIEDIIEKHLRPSVKLAEMHQI